MNDQKYFSEQSNLSSFSSNSNNSIKCANSSIDTITSGSTMPSRNTFHFDALTFSSDFCSGNLHSVTRLDPITYLISTAPDNMGQPYESTHRMWFYFSISGHSYGQIIKFKLDKVSSFKNLFRNGHRPVFRTERDGWDQINIDTEIDQGTNVNLNFTLILEDTSTHYVAFTFPFSYDDCCEQIDVLEDKITACLPPNTPNNQKFNQNIYFHRMNLCNSYEGRKVEILTVSSMQNIKDTKEDWNTVNPKEVQSRLFSNKRQVFLSSRVHPGEVTGQWALIGFLEQLVSNDYHAELLRNNFVFKIVLMINPDGVSRGHQRLDSLGNNLNRQQNCADVNLHPNIYQICEYIRNLNEIKKLFFQMDFHSHPGKKSCFIYANFLSFWNMVDSQQQVKLLSQNNVNFDIEGCVFEEKMMAIKDKRDNLSRTGCGRVGIMKLTGCKNCYTMECNQSVGRNFNYLAPFYNEKHQKDSNHKKYSAEKSYITNCNSDQYKSSKPLQKIEVFKDVGYSAAISLLDQINVNPVNRIRRCDLGSQNAIQTSVALKLCLIPPFKSDLKLKYIINQKATNKDFEFFKNLKENQHHFMEQNESQKFREKFKSSCNLTNILSQNTSSISFTPNSNNLLSLKIKSTKHTSEREKRYNPNLKNLLLTPKSNHNSTKNLISKSAKEAINNPLIINTNTQGLKNYLDSIFGPSDHWNMHEGFNAINTPQPNQSNKILLNDRHSKSTGNITNINTSNVSYNKSIDDYQNNHYFQAKSEAGKYSLTESRNKSRITRKEELKPLLNKANTINNSDKIMRKDSIEIKEDIQAKMRRSTSNLKKQDGSTTKNKQKFNYYLKNHENLKQFTLKKIKNDIFNNDYKKYSIN